MNANQVNEGIEPLSSGKLMELVTEELSRSDVENTISRKLSSLYGSSPKNKLPYV